MSNIIKRQLIKKWIEKEIEINKNINEEKIILESFGIKINKNNFEINVNGNGKSFDVIFDENANFSITKNEKRKRGFIEINSNTSKNKINISDITFEEEEVMKRQVKIFSSPERRQSLEESLKELKRKNKKRIKDIQEEMNEKIGTYFSNNFKHLTKIIESLNNKETLKGILGDSFLSKEKRLKKIKNNTIIKSMINLCKDKREERVSVDIKKLYIKIFKKNGDMMGLDPKNFSRFIMQMTLIMKEIQMLDKILKGLKKIKKALKTELDDLIELKLEELVDMIRKDDEDFEEIIQKLNPKALLSSIENELNKYYRKEEVYIE